MLEGKGGLNAVVSLDFLYLLYIGKRLVVQSWPLCWAKTIKVEGALGEWFPRRLLAHQILV